jgi:hypothetical protein
MSGRAGSIVRKVDELKRGTRWLVANMKHDHSAKALAAMNEMRD